MIKKQQLHKGLIVAGTRPEAIKMIPVIQALQKSDFCEPVVARTGQHKRRVDELFKHAGIDPATNLAAGGANINLLWMHVIDALIWGQTLRLPFDQPEIAELYKGDSKIVLVRAA